MEQDRSITTLHRLTLCSVRSPHVVLMHVLLLLLFMYFVQFVVYRTIVTSIYPLSHPYLYRPMFYFVEFFFTSFYVFTLISQYKTVFVELLVPVTQEASHTYYRACNSNEAYFTTKIHRRKLLSVYSWPLKIHRDQKHASGGQSNSKANFSVTKKKALNAVID